MNCPQCGRGNVDPGELVKRGAIIRQRATCTPCGATWTDVYTLTRTESIKTPGQSRPGQSRLDE